jgi:D-arabinitol dehydrogenase (NADP+)
VASSGVCGTDLHLFTGELKCDYPLIPGHEVVGTIVGLGAAVTSLKSGMRVAFDPNIPCGQCHFCRRLKFNHCLNWQAVGVNRPGGFAELVAVPAKSVFPVDDLPFDQAVFIEPLSCVVYGLQRATPALGDRVLIFGAGPIGLLMLQSVRRAGAAAVVVSDLQAERLTLATALGAERVVQAGADQQANLRALAPYGYDMVIDATGVPAVAVQCFDYATPGAKVLLFGVCPEDATFAFSPYNLYRRDITVIGSFALNMTFAPAIELLKSGAVQVGPLVSHRFPLEQFPKALEIAHTRSEPSAKILIEP